MIRRKIEAGLMTWIERARASLVASFVSGVAKDEAAGDAEAAGTTKLGRLNLVGLRPLMSHHQATCILRPG